MHKLSLALLITLPFLSFVTQACQIIPSDTRDEYYINKNCKLIPYRSSNRTITNNTFFFVQYFYANNFKQFTNSKNNIQKKLKVPVASQPYKGGYRVLIGPFKLKTAKVALSYIKKMGYSDALIKFYTPVITKQKQHEALSPQSKSRHSTKPLSLPNLLSIYTLNGNVALLPTYEPSYTGRTTRYNNILIGSYTYQQASAICHAANARIANRKEYNLILSNINFIMDFGAKSQFWVAQMETITRVQNKVSFRKQRPNSYFNVICVTQ